MYDFFCSKFYKHVTKLQKANLPESCNKINVYKIVIDSTSNKSRTIKISNKLIDSIISIPTYTTDTFENVNGVPLIVQLRWRCFFTDYDNEENCWFE